MACVAMHTDRGRVKSVDQDGCCYLEASTSIGRVIMAVICDGVGGLSKGELASTTVIQRFSQWFAEDLPTFIGFNGDDPHMLESIQNVWDTLLQIASENIYGHGEREGVTLGTTFTGMIVVGGRYLIGHVGDCRAYEIANAGVRQPTSDQTLVAQQVAAGIITPEQAATHPKRNVILQSVGTHDGVEPEFVMGEYNPKATYLFCCDGFYNKLSAEELAGGFAPSEFATEDGLRQTCAQYVEGVLGRGEKDNVTVLAFTEAFEHAEPSVPADGAQGAVSADDPGQPAQGFTAPSLFAAPARAEAAIDDEDESPTIVVAEEDSPTIVVQGGDE